MRNSVCHNCPKRDYPRCHTGCRERGEEVARNEAIKEAERRDKEAHSAYMDVTRRGKAKAGQR